MSLHGDSSYVPCVFVLDFNKISAIVSRKYAQLMADLMKALCGMKN